MHVDNFLSPINILVYALLETRVCNVVEPFDAVASSPAPSDCANEPTMACVDELDWQRTAAPLTLVGAEISTTKS
jgi:hypothetical protein